MIDQLPIEPQIMKQALPAIWYALASAVATPALFLYMIKRWVSRVEKRLDSLEQNFIVFQKELIAVEEKVVKRNAFERKMDGLNKDREKMMEKITELKVSLARFEAVQEMRK